MAQSTAVVAHNSPVFPGRTLPSLPIGPAVQEEGCRGLAGSRGGGGGRQTGYFQQGFDQPAGYCFVGAAGGKEGAGSSGREAAGGCGGCVGIRRSCHYNCCCSYRYWRGKAVQLAREPYGMHGVVEGFGGLWMVRSLCSVSRRVATSDQRWCSAERALPVIIWIIASLKPGQVRDVPCLLLFLPVGLVPGVIQYMNYPMLGATHTCHRVCILQESGPQPDGIGPPEEVNIASAEASALQYLGLLAVTIAAGFFFFQKAFDDGEVHWLPLLGTLVTAYLTYEGVYYLRLQNYVDTVQRPQSRVRTPWKDVILLLPDSPRQ